LRGWSPEDINDGYPKAIALRNAYITDVTQDALDLVVCKDEPRLSRTLQRLLDQIEQAEAVLIFDAGRRWCINPPIPVTLAAAL
jgi:hypothetical protein